MWLLFYTQEKAEKALQEINKLMEFPNNGTETWDIIQQAYKDKLWFFRMPDAKYMFKIDFDEMRANVKDLLPPPPKSKLKVP